jgi:hypothetical protein
VDLVVASGFDAALGIRFDAALASAFCFWFISVAPVRGGTYFSLPAAKKSRQKKAAHTEPLDRKPRGVRAACAANGV